MLQKLIVSLRKIRAKESLMMTPFFLVGYFYSKPNIDNIFSLQFLCIVCYFYLQVQSIYLLNSFFGQQSDKFNRRFKGITIDRKDTAVFFAISSILLLGLAFVIAYNNGWGGRYGILLNYALWFIYVYPNINFKGHYIGASVIHFVSGIVNFQLGYLIYNALSVEAILCSVYFSLLFVFGHAHHMILDYEADKASGYNTLAVKYGVRKTSIIAMFILVLATLYYVILWRLGYVVFLSIVPVVASFLCHLLLYYRFYLQLDDFTQRLKYRRWYRIIHALGIAAIAIIYTRWFS